MEQIAHDPSTLEKARQVVGLMAYLGLGNLDDDISEQRRLVFKRLSGIN